ncbi:MAG: hypothetical protein ABJO01_08785 [Parasphingorhabdus sp.]|uniref:hypothetical protein n=1 Tax=Parasphingorhabdus sp. TaxID=2709688 RepID=UPI00329A0AFC
MDPNIYVAIVSAVSSLSYYFALFMAGLARGRFKIAVPSHSVRKTPALALCEHAAHLYCSRLLNRRSVPSVREKL